MRRPLSKKQEMFCREYLMDLNAAGAARRAGYSKKAANKMGYHLLTKIDIQQKIRELMEQRAARLDLSADQVVQELGRIAFGSLWDVCTWGPDGVKLRDGESLTPEQRRLVESMSQTVTREGGSVRVKMVSRLAALELLGRHLGLFKDKVEVSSDLGGPEELAAIMQELQEYGFRPPNPAVKGVWPEDDPRRGSKL